jgi:hypothetical protein
MADVRIEHVFNCSADTFWDKLFFDDEYNDTLFKQALEFPVYEKLKEEKSETEVRRAIHVVPKLGPMPGPLKTLVGDGLGYREDGVYDKKTRHYRTVITPNKLAEKITIQGDFWVEPKGDKQCLRIFECSVTAKIFGVGGMLEKRVISDMEASYEKSAKFTNEWIAKKGLG